MTKTLSLDLSPRIEAAVYLSGAVVLAGSAYYAWQSGGVLPLIVLGSVLGVIIVLNDEEMASNQETVPDQAVTPDEKTLDEQPAPRGAETSDKPTTPGDDHEPSLSSNRSDGDD